MNVGRDAVGRRPGEAPARRESSARRIAYHPRRLFASPDPVPRDRDMERVLALLIPVLAMSIGLVAVLRMPREALAARRHRPLPAPAPESAALVEEVTQLREEVAQLRERVDFTERLLSGPAATPVLAPAQPAATSASA